ncbi:MAG: GNAT family N-acetyltransferase [Clostridia bacterium]|nr:GNAT family N-acetyltransferase [Clostridia bacterium]
MKKLFYEIPNIEGKRIVLRRLMPSDSDSLNKLKQSDEVYRWLPTFLCEKKYDDDEYVIEHLYDECLEESLILGIFLDDKFCGLAEIYGYRAPFLKVSVGYRLLPEFWGQGIATETLGLMISFLFYKTNIKVITASTMVENTASANVLKKNGFKRIAHDVFENWGYPSLTKTDKWIKTVGGNIRYPFNKT